MLGTECIPAAAAAIAAAAAAASVGVSAGESWASTSDTAAASLAPAAATGRSIRLDSKGAAAGGAAAASRWRRCGSSSSSAAATAFTATPAASEVAPDAAAAPPPSTPPLTPPPPPTAVPPTAPPTPCVAIVADARRLSASHAARLSSSPMTSSRSRASSSSERGGFSRSPDAGPSLRRAMSTARPYRTIIGRRSAAATLSGGASCSPTACRSAAAVAESPPNRTDAALRASTPLGAIDSSAAMAAAVRSTVSPVLCGLARMALEPRGGRGGSDGVCARAATAWPPLAAAPPPAPLMGGDMGRRALCWCGCCTPAVAAAVGALARGWCAAPARLLAGCR